MDINEKLKLRSDVIRNIGIKLSELLKRHFKDNFISLAIFGSVSRGKIRDGSDIDFLIVLEKMPKSYGKRIKMVFPVVEEMKENVEYKRLEKLEIYLEPSFLALSEREIRDHPPLLLDMTEEVILLYDKEHFLKKELERVKKRLKKLGSLKRMLPDGSWYWALKPDLKIGERIEI